MLWTSMIGGKKVLIASGSERKEDLIFLKELIEAGKDKTGHRSTLSVGADGRGPQVCRRWTQEGKCGHNCGT